MSEEIDNVPQPVEQDNVSLSFLTDPKKHPLMKTLKLIQKEIPEAVNVIATLMMKDETDSKLKVECAKTLIQMQKEIVDMQQKEWLARLTQEVRKNISMNTKPNMKNIGGNVDGEDDDDEDSVPIYRPDIVLDVSNVNNL